MYPSCTYIFPRTVLYFMVSRRRRKCCLEFIHLVNFTEIMYAFATKICDSTATMHRQRRLYKHHHELELSAQYLFLFLCEYISVWNSVSGSFERMAERQRNRFLKIRHEASVCTDLIYFIFWPRWFPGRIVHSVGITPGGPVKAQWIIY